MASNLDFKDFPFVKRMREAGIKTALQEGLNDVVYRLTPGLDIEAFRGMLRGDPPARPNPRLTPHADGFWLHMRPGYYNEAVTGLYPTFRLGWLSTYFFVFELLTGIFLMIFYTPSAIHAYDNMLNILSNVPFGKLMRDMHRLGAEAMVLLVAAHMLRTFWTASYKKPRQFTWATGILLLFFTLGLSYTGYLLPWDQLAYWAVTIGASMAEATPPPIVGAFINVLIKGAPSLGADGLLRFYLLHVIGFPLVLIVLFGVHYYKVIIHGHSLPPENEKTGEDNAKRIKKDVRRYFLPDIVSSEILWTIVVTFILTFMVIFTYSAPLENLANPLSTPLHTIAPWYFLWAQGLLKLGDKTIMGVVIPMMILLPAFIFMPYIDIGPFRRYGKRRIAFSMSMLFMIFIAITSWMGTPAFLVQTSLDQEIFFELAPGEKVGKVRALPYEEIAYGTYEVGSDWRSQIDEDSELYEVMEFFEEEVHYASEVSLDRGGLPGAIASMTIFQAQPNVKGVILSITWDAQDGEPITSELFVPIHADAYPHGEEH